MYRTGHVVELTAHHMRLSLDPSPTACSSCQNQQGGCGGLLSAWWQQTRQRAVLQQRQSSLTTALFATTGAAETLDLDRLSGASVGDRVRVDISPVLALQLAFIAYCVPVLLLLVGAVIGHVVFQMRGWDVALTAVPGLIGFVGGLFAYRPLVKVLLDGRNNGRNAHSNSLLKTSLFIGPG